MKLFRYEEDFSCSLKTSHIKTLSLTAINGLMQVIYEISHFYICHLDIITTLYIVIYIARFSRCQSLKVVNIHEIYVDTSFGVHANSLTVFEESL